MNQQGQAQDQRQGRAPGKGGAPGQGGPGGFYVCLFCHFCGPILENLSSSEELERHVGGGDQFGAGRLGDDL